MDDIYTPVGVAPSRRCSSPLVRTIFSDDDDVDDDLGDEDDDDDVVVVHVEKEADADADAEDVVRVILVETTVVAGEDVHALAAIIRLPVIQIIAYIPLPMSRRYQEDVAWKNFEEEIVVATMLNGRSVVLEYSQLVWILLQCKCNI